MCYNSISKYWFAIYYLLRKHNEKKKKKQDGVISFLRSADPAASTLAYKYMISKVKLTYDNTKLKVK